MAIRILRQSDADPRALALCVANQAWRDRATLLKQDARAAVYRGADQHARPVIVKRMSIRGLKARLKSLLGKSRLARQWRGSDLLNRAGIVTSRCRALFREGASETLVLDWVDGPTLAELIAHASTPVRAEHAVARAIGAQAAAIAGAGLFNRDHKASNLVVRTGASGNPEIVLIDTVGIREGLTAIDLMLAKTMIELIGIGHPPRRALCMRALNAAEPRHTKDAWRAIAAIIARHGDPTPKVNPLAPPS